MRQRIYSIFICMGLLTTIGAYGNALLLVPNVQGHVAQDEIVRALDIGGQYFIDIISLSEILSFELNPDNRSGTFMSRPFTIGADTLPIRRYGRDYYTLGFFENLFPIQMGVNYRELQLTINSAYTLPPTLAIQNARRRQNMMPAPERDSFANYDFDDRLFTTPIIDVIYRRTESRNRDGDWHSGDFYQVNAAMIFAGLDTNVTVFGDNFGSNEMTNPRARIRAGQTMLQEPHNQLNLVQFEFGDIFGGTRSMFHRSAPGRGLSASSFKDLITSADRTINIEGFMPYGWEAELFLNNQLIGFKQTGIDGRYSFRDVPVTFGLNNFRVVLHGPFGETQTIERRYFSGTTPVRAGEIGYNISAIQPNRFLIEDNEHHVSDSNDIVVDTMFYYGVTDHFTVMGGASNVQSATRPHQNLQFVTTGAQMSLNGVSIQYNIYQNLDNQHFGHHFDVQGNIFIGDIFMRFEHFGDTNSPISHYRGQYLQNLFEGRLTGWIPGINMPYFISYMRNDFPSQEIRARISPSLGRGYHMSIENRWRDTDGHIENSVYTMLQMSQRNFRAFARARYQTNPYAYLAEYGIFTEYRWNRNTFINASWNRHIRSRKTTMDDLDSGTLGVGRLFPFGGIQAFVRGDSDRNLSFGLTYNISFGKVPNNSRMFANSETQMTNFGAVHIRAMDDAGMPVENARIFASGRQAVTTTDERGHAMIVNLQPYQKLILNIDEQDIDDLSLVPTVQQKRVVLRPGTVRPIDIPFQRTGGIEGQATGMNGAQIYRAHIVNMAGEPVAVQTIDFDGSFIFDGIKFGYYRLKIINGNNDVLNVMDINIDRNFQSLRTKLVL